MAQRKRTPWVWLIVAALLLALGAWLMRGAEPPERERPEVRMPRQMNRDERERSDERRTWSPVVVSDAGVQTSQKARDPVLALMPTEVKELAVVAEFNAIMNSELGLLMNQCLFGGEDDQMLSRLRDAGIDPLKTIDRVAMIDDAMVMTGDFKGGGWKQFLPERALSKQYGQRGEITELPFADAGSMFMGSWNGQMLLQAENEEALKALIDRAEAGNLPEGSKPVLDESMAYGEVYGVFKSSAFTGLVGEQDERLSTLLKESASSMQLHMDVSHDVGLVADVDAPDPAKAEELRRALGGALSIARMRAKAKGDQDQSDIFDLAKVEPTKDGEFRLEAGLPHEFMKKALDQCIANRKRKRAAAAEEDAETR